VRFLLSTLVYTIYYSTDYPYSSAVWRMPVLLTVLIDFCGFSKPFHIDICILKNKNQLDATYYFIVLLIGSTCFRHYCAHRQELVTIMLITTLVISFCKDGGGSINVKLWFLVVYVRCEVLCRLVVAGNVFLLILIVVIVYVW